MKSRTSSGGRGRTGGAKKSFGKSKGGDRKFSSARPASKPFRKREDRDEKPYRERSAGSSPFNKKGDKPFSSRSKPFGKSDDRDDKPFRERSGEGRDFKKPFGKGRSDDKDRRPFGERSGERRDFKKPYEKKFSAGKGRSDDRPFSGRSKPFGKREDRDDKPFGERSGERRDFKKPFGKGRSDDRPFSGRSKPFGKGRSDEKDDRPFSSRSKPFGKGRSDEKDDRPFSSRSKPFGKGRSDEKDDRPFRERSDDRKEFKKPFGKRDDERSEKRMPSDDRPFDERSDDRKDFKKPFDKKDERDGRPFTGRSKPFVKKDDRDEKPKKEPTESFHPTEDGKDFVKRIDKPKRKRSDEAIPDEENKRYNSGARIKSENPGEPGEEKSFTDHDETPAPETERKWNRKSDHEFYGDKKKKPTTGRDRKREKKESYTEDDGSIRLNKYISNSGICSRREADELITAGVVSVNGEIMTQLGYKVKQDDVVKYNNETLRAEKLVYILVNKPKDFITTMDDPQDRKTVMWLVRDACRERVYPVGRLDRNTTGVLLLTNDGELTKKLTHPSFEIQKIYQVELDSSLKPSDMETISNGVTLDDGFIKVDDIAYAGTGNDKSIVGVELHSGKNRIVRRIFEQLGYQIKKLDRVYFAGLSKKDLPRGRWRFLSPIEVSNLKMMTGNKKMQKYYEA